MATVARANRAQRRAWKLPRRLLLASGVTSSLFYALANDVVAASIYGGYSRISRAISELSATYAPSRPVLVPLLIVYEGLVIGFGVGVWQSARGKRALRITSALLIGGATLGLAGLAFPLTQPPSAQVVGGNLPLSDTMHNIVNGGLGHLLMLVTYGFGAAALGKRFRLYSIATAAAELAGGLLMFLTASGALGAEAQHWVGAAERVMAAAWLLWVGVFSIALLRAARLPGAAKAA